MGSVEERKPESCMKKGEAMSTDQRGTFIALEGIDGSGKSTQIRMLSDWLQERQISVYVTMEPTEGPVGSVLRQILTGRMQADPRVIAALFTADRLDHLLNEVDGIVHKIRAGVSVLMDRYYFSSYAYQSVDIPMEQLILANAQSSGILRPDVNIFIDIDPQLAMERIAKNRFHRELFEEKSRLTRVRQKYMEAFERLKDTEKVVIVDGNQERKKVAEDIRAAVQEYFRCETEPITGKTGSDTV